MLLKRKVNQVSKLIRIKLQPPYSIPGVECNDYRASFYCCKIYFSTRGNNNSAQGIFHVSKCVNVMQRIIKVNLPQDSE